MPEKQKKVKPISKKEKHPQPAVQSRGEEKEFKLPEEEIDAMVDSSIKGMEQELAAYEQSSAE